MFEHSIDERGNLVITADADGREDIRRWEADGLGDADVEGRVFDELRGLFPLAPEDIGALTSAPILTDDVEHDDAAKVIRVGRVWWFPNYQVEAMTQTLRDAGKVTMTLATEDE
jgi:hypothetical protein